MTNFDKISSIIAERKLTAADCAYHTMRVLDNNGRIRALVVRGDETIVHVEMICPKCGAYDYHTEAWVPISKAAKIRLTNKCTKCGEKVKIEKLKGAKIK
jgi:hypothetical protein